MVASGAAVEAEVEIDAPGNSRQDKPGAANDQCVRPYESFTTTVAADRQLWLHGMKLTAVFFHDSACVPPVIDRFGKRALMSRCLLRIYPEVMS